MARMVASGELLSKKQFAASAMMRLGAVSLVGFGLVVLFWPAASPCCSAWPCSR